MDSSIDSIGPITGTYTIYDSRQGTTGNTTGIANQATLTQDIIRQLQRAIQLGGQSHASAQQPQAPTAPVSVSIQQRQRQNVGPASTPMTPGAGATLPEYSYKVKVINPSKKTDVIVRQLNRLSSKFASVTNFRMKIMEEFGECVPNTLNFTVGYFDGSQQAKIWLVTSDDLQTMYKKYPRGGNVSLWCYGRSSAESDCARTQKRERDSDPSSAGTSHQENEEDVESVFKELCEKHGSKFDTPRLRLWSRMITSGLHEDYDNPRVFLHSQEVPPSDLAEIAYRML